MKYLPKIILVAYMLTTFLPNLGGIDRIGFQWLYLSLLNTFSTLYLWNLKEFNFKILRNKNIQYFILFFIISLISVLFALNIQESIIEITRIFNYVLTLVCLTLVSKKIEDPIKFISSIFSLALIIELGVSYYEFQNILLYTEYDFSQANLLQGIASNKNITASAMLLKLPFVLGYFLNKNLIIKIIASFVSFAAIFMIYLLSARAMFIGLALFYTILFFLILFFYNDSFKFKISNIFKLFFPLIASTTLFLVVYNKNNSVSLVSRASTINTNDESTNQRIRFYKHGLNHVVENPLIPTGIGNWKILSIKYDNKDMIGYVVPYHLHNDFLQFSAELGIIGGLAYVMVFFITMLQNFKKLYSKYLKRSLLIKEGFPLSLLILLSLLIFIIDSNLNFPFSRPMIMIPLIIVLSLSNYHNEKHS